MSSCRSTRGQRSSPSGPGRRSCRVAINGTRWLAFGKVVRVRVGTPIPTIGLRADREVLREVTDRLQADLGQLVLGYPDRRVPGPVGRWLTDAFADRPWRAAEAAAAAAAAADGSRVHGSRRCRGSRDRTTSDRRLTVRGVHVRRRDRAIIARLIHALR